MVDVALRTYSFAPTSEPKLTNPDEVQEAIRDLKVGKAPGPGGIPNRALKHLPLRVIFLLVIIINAILTIQYFPSKWKQAHVISIPKPRKNPALLSSYRLICLLDTVGKLFEKILLARFLKQVSECGLLCDEQFGFRPKHSTSLQPACLVERVTRNSGNKRLTGAIFLHVAKAFHTVWVNGLVYKSTVLNFPSYPLRIITSYPRGRTFEASFQTATSTRRGMRAEVAQGGLISLVLFSLYVNDMPISSHHVELTTWPPQPRPRSQRCFSATWNHISVISSNG